MIEQRGDYFSRIEFSVAGFGKVCAVAFESLCCKLLNVVDFADGNNGVSAEFTDNDQRLIFKVTDDTDTGFPGKLANVIIELGTELRIGNIVNTAVDIM